MHHICCQQATNFLSKKPPLLGRSHFLSQCYWYLDIGVCNAYMNNCLWIDDGPSLVLFSRCVVPPVTVLSPILDYGRCFLRHPYEHSVKLHNDSDLPAKYELLPQQINEDTPIVYSSPKAKVCNRITEGISLCQLQVMFYSIFCTFEFHLY